MEMGRIGQYNAENNGGVDQHGKVAVGVFPVALAQGLGDDGAAAGADHEAHGAHDHQGGEDEVHGGEGGLAHVVGDEQAVYDAVNGGADHHNNGRQDEAQEFGVGEVVGQLDSHRSVPPGLGLVGVGSEMGSFWVCSRSFWM